MAFKLTSNTRKTKKPLETPQSCNEEATPFIAVKHNLACHVEFELFTDLLVHGTNNP